MKSDANPISKYKAIRELLVRALTRHQILVLKELRANGIYKNVTSLVEDLSINYNIPASTLRWNLKKLVEFGLIITGNRDNKGIPVKLTDSGELVCKILG